MPELPEVETIKNSLQANVGARIKYIEIKRSDILKLRAFELKEIHGKSLSSISRKGKFLVLKMADKLNIALHMGMSGRFFIKEENDEITEKHVHMIVYLDNGRKLLYQDPRRFGGVFLLRDTEEFFSRLGVEPLSRDFNPRYLEKISKNRKIAIKSLILKQELICGIGNIYADEALFEAGVRPDRPAGSLKIDEFKALSRAIKKVLKKGIKYRGTTFRDYRDGFNQEGNFQKHLQVYGKTGEKCPCCKAPLSRQIIGGRSSHYCGRCQT
jgi:formamidopyrimidine-DNA glycosylase